MEVEAWWRQNYCHAGCDTGFVWVGTWEGVKGGGCPSWVSVKAFMRGFFDSDEFALVA